MDPELISHPMLSASIGDVVYSAWDAISSPLADFAEQHILNNTIVKWLCDSALKPLTDSMLTLADNTYNTLVTKSYGLLTQDPKSWSPEGWSMISRINDTFISTIGLSLVVVFFAIGFCKESLDPKQDLRFENVLRMFIKLSVASWFVCNAINIVAAMFGLVGLVTGGNTFGSSRESMASYFDTVYNALVSGGTTYNEMLGDLILMALAAAAYTVISVMVGVALLYQAFTRFFKILVLIPYGSLASATIAGDHQTAQSAASFYKYALNCVLEAATMIIALLLFAKMSGSMPQGLGLFHTPAASLRDVTGRIITEIILMFTLYGVTKQSAAITQRALGL